MTWLDDATCSSLFAAWLSLCTTGKKVSVSWAAESQSVADQSSLGEVRTTRPARESCTIVWGMYLLPEAFRYPRGPVISCGSTTSKLGLKACLHYRSNGVGWCACRVWKCIFNAFFRPSRSWKQSSSHPFRVDVYLCRSASASYVRCRLRHLILDRSLHIARQHPD